MCAESQLGAESNMHGSSDFLDASLHGPNHMHGGNAPGWQYTTSRLRLRAGRAGTSRAEC